MAVRFSASTQSYTRNLGLEYQTATTISCWSKVSTDRNAYSAFLSISDGVSGTDYLSIYTDSGGTGVQLWDDSADTRTSTITMAANTWHFTAGVMNGSSGTLYVRALTDTAFSTASYSTGSASQRWDILTLGGVPWAGEWLNGCVCAVKIWNAALTQAELEREARQYMPARTENLQAWYPLTQLETTDYSGNGQTLAGGSGATLEDGPNLTWRSLGRGSTDLIVRETVVALGRNASVRPILAVDGTPTSYVVIAGPNLATTFTRTVSGVTDTDVVAAGDETTFPTGASTPGDVTFVGLDSDDTGV